MKDKENYIVTKRDGWFNGDYTHKVVSTKMNKIICVSNDHGCAVVAKALNMVDTLSARYES